MKRIDKTVDEVLVAEMEGADTYAGFDDWQKTQAGKPSLWCDEQMFIRDKKTLELAIRCLRQQQRTADADKDERDRVLFDCWRLVVDEEARRIWELAPKVMQLDAQASERWRPRLIGEPMQPQAQMIFKTMSGCFAVDRFMRESWEDGKFNKRHVLGVFFLGLRAIEIPDESWRTPIFEKTIEAAFDEYGSEFGDKYVDVFHQDLIATFCELMALERIVGVNLI